MRWTRRGVTMALVALAGSPLRAAPKLSDDGMYHFDWYLESFLDIAEDIDTARAAGKRFALMWGQRACPYCRQMAEVHLSDPAIVSYIRAHFEIVHLNLFGSREVTDLDGSKVAERDLARVYGVRTTPTIIFFPPAAEGLARRPALQREVARMPGLLEPKQFLAMFKYVSEEGYRSDSFPAWLARQG
jgi:thioredoxin-related protein